MPGIIAGMTTSGTTHANAPAPRRPTRLLLVTNMYPTPDRPQTGPFVARRVASLRARGVDVVVVGPSSYRRSAALRHLGIAWRALTTRGRFDGVEAHPVYAAGLLGLVAARLRRVPLLAYAHGADISDYATRGLIHRTFAGLVVRHADAIVANSSFTAGYVEQLGATARVVSPGVDMAVFLPGPEGPDERRSLREGLGLPEGLLALYLGTLSERKGADVFATAIDLASGSGATPAWVGVMLGDGPLAESLTRSHPSIRQCPPVPADEVAAWIQAADVVAVPSRREPLGLAAAEALACGKPVVASSVGGLREIVVEGVNGLVIPPGDPTALAAALDRLRDAEMRARLGAAGPRSVARHDIRATAIAMAEAWSELGVLV